MLSLRQETHVWVFQINLSYLAHMHFRFQFHAESNMLVDSSTNDLRFRCVTARIGSDNENIENEIKITAWV